ncbi:hypothetical protein IFM89_033691 [Coptis chinensis]|uniref:EF-hand domain-containing protein n=1 Tax=Coptis chinensis TaxID=261450 RepID=A0A835HGP6_9MAGN|nr:hypothetical protein IFM89_033691 [Coptis chinensis]
MPCRSWDQMMENGFTLDRAVSETLVNAIKAKYVANVIRDHPCIKDDGEAPDTPLNNVVLSRLEQFRAMNKFWKIALRADADGNGTIGYDEFITTAILMNRTDEQERHYTAFQFQYFDKDNSRHKLNDKKNKVDDYPMIREGYEHTDDQVRPKATANLASNTQSNASVVPSSGMTAEMQQYPETNTHMTSCQPTLRNAKANVLD